MTIFMFSPHSFPSLIRLGLICGYGDMVMQLKELTRAEEAAERLSAEYEKKLLLLQQKESLELVKVSITSRRQAARGRGGWCSVFLVLFFVFLLTVV